MKLTLFHLLLLLNYVRGKPLSDLQSLKQILEEMKGIPHGSSEETLDGEKSERGDPDWRPGDFSDPGNSALEAKTHVFSRLFKDLFRTSKGSWGRYKKGGLRSCFGVRLDRIGSFSGLGC
ncbi:natriuretic peptide A-like [Entelurus aequoreus]|uniref:natriuretic peptide A-like n=1 Tax=Entelurus aequoreus TaxID=161455 RepID=UPI002B1E7F9A|nr:natriuretic peptide A-like [Entelurus aequoreus]XP_061908437.1 natriuretic peptide A-like [Entelurus aequoreus]